MVGSRLLSSHSHINHKASLPSSRSHIRFNHTSPESCRPPQIHQLQLKLISIGGILKYLEIWRMLNHRTWWCRNLRKFHGKIKATTVSILSTFLLHITSLAIRWWRDSLHKASMPNLRCNIQGIHWACRMCSRTSLTSIKSAFTIRIQLWCNHPRHFLTISRNSHRVSLASLSVICSSSNIEVTSKKHQHFHNETIDSVTLGMAGWCLHRLHHKMCGSTINLETQQRLSNGGILPKVVCQDRIKTSVLSHSHRLQGIMLSTRDRRSKWKREMILVSKDRNQTMNPKDRKYQMAH